jgi:ABC-type Na+ efflux pump permease subunit
MSKEVFLIIKKEIIETIRNKRKLWPFLFTVIPIFMFFYTKGSESLFPPGYAVYILPVFISTLIGMQISSTSLLNEKSTHMLDILLAMKIKPLVIVFSKNIFSALFALIISFIIILMMKTGSIHFFKEDLLTLNLGYFIFIYVISYLCSGLTFLISLLIREQSIIPMTSSLALILIIGPIFWLFDINKIPLFSNINLLFISTIILVLNFLISLICSYVLKNSKFIVSI